MTKPTVFISYSHKDEDWKDRLQMHLEVLQFVGIFDLWEDRSIRGGDKWFEEIKKAIEKADIAILMVSANSLTSKFILKDEIPEFLKKREEKGLRVYPVIVKPCAWKRVKWLSIFQVRPLDGKPLLEGTENDQEMKLMAIADEIAGILERAEEGSDGIIEIPPNKIALAKLPATTHTLFGRDDKLKILDEAWSDPKTHIVSLVAFGGVGKTALVNTWLKAMREAHFCGAERVYGWSFYSQGASEDRQISADAFLAETLRWFGDPTPDAGSPWQKGERLAEYVKKQRTLLILDGMEPLQDPHQGGRVKDPGLQSLLRELAYDNPGLCVVSTRLSVADLEEFTQTTVRAIPLEELSPEAGAELLASLGVNGTEEERRQASEEFGGHALALTLLGNYLAMEFEGEIRRRDEIPRLMDEESKGGHARRVMRSYERIFEGKPELDILHILGLFDRPVPKAAIDALTQEPTIEGLTDRLRELPETKWNRALTHLRNVGLLNKDETNHATALDCHPLIREHFGERLQEENPDAWKEAHGRLYEYYKTSAKEFPDTIEEMEPLYAAVMHGCRAGRYQEALDEVYRERILRRNEYFSVNKLGAFGSDLAAVSCFFENLWDRPAAELSEPDQAVLLNSAGAWLRALGRLREAAQPLKAAVDHVIKKDWERAAVGSGNLSELFLTVGDVEPSVEFARQSVEYADRSGDDFWKMGTRTTLADAQHQAGRLSEAEAGFGEAEIMQKEWQPEYPLLYSLPGYRYCDLLLSRGKYADVKRRAEQTIEWMIAQNWLLDIALDTLSLGRAEWMRVLQEGDGDFGEAGEILNRAVDGLRKAGAQDHIPRGLLARAELYRYMKDFERAHKDLREAMTIATRGEMRLHEADCHLQYGRLFLEKGEIGVAREHLQKAADRIEDIQYGRRRPEVQVDFARLLLAEGDREGARERLRRGKELVESMGYHCLDREVRELEGVLGS